MMGVEMKTQQEERYFTETRQRLNKIVEERQRTLDEESSKLKLVETIQSVEAKNQSKQTQYKQNPTNHRATKREQMNSFEALMEERKKQMDIEKQDMENKRQSLVAQKMLSKLGHDRFEKLQEAIGRAPGGVAKGFQRKDYKKETLAVPLGASVPAAGALGTAFKAPNTIPTPNNGVASKPQPTSPRKISNQISMPLPQLSQPTSPRKTGTNPNQLPSQQPQPQQPQPGYQPSNPFLTQAAPLVQPQVSMPNQWPSTVADQLQYPPGHYVPPQQMYYYYPTPFGTVLQHAPVAQPGMQSTVAPGPTYYPAGGFPDPSLAGIQPQAGNAAPQYYYYYPAGTSGTPGATGSPSSTNVQTTLPK